MTFLDVGQGDSAVIETPSGKVVVIDGGGNPGTDEREGRDPGTRIVVPFLRSRGINSVDLLVPTHPDDDHVQGLLAVVRRLPVRAALDGGYPAASGTPMARLRQALAVRRVPVRTARRGQRIDLGDGVVLEVLHPRDPFLSGGRSDSNDNSIALRLVYRDVRVLFTADLEEAAERDVVSSGQDLSAQVLKVGHHGSRSSTTWPLLRAVNPQAAIVSCGRDNRFGHPHRAVLARLTGIPVLRTDLQGAMTLVTDGKSIRFTEGTSPARSRCVLPTHLKQDRGVVWGTMEE